MLHNAAQCFTMLHNASHTLISRLACGKARCVTWIDAEKAPLLSLRPKPWTSRSSESLMQPKMGKLAFRKARECQNDALFQCSAEVRCKQRTYCIFGVSYLFVKLPDFDFPLSLLCSANDLCIFGCKPLGLSSAAVCSCSGRYALYRRVWSGAQVLHWQLLHPAVSNHLQPKI